MLWCCEVDESWFLLFAITITRSLHKYSTLTHAPEFNCVKNDTKMFRSTAVKSRRDTIHPDMDEDFQFDDRRSLDLIPNYAMTDRSASSNRNRYPSITPSWGVRHKWSEWTKSTTSWNRNFRPLHNLSTPDRLNGAECQIDTSQYDKYRREEQ